MSYDNQNIDNKNEANQNYDIENDSVVKLPDGMIEMECPECHQYVIIDGSNVCPKCGCEFEEVEKSYRLLNVASFLGILATVIYVIVSIVFRFINRPDNIDADSLFYMDAFRFTSTTVFILTLLISAIVIALFVADVLISGFEMRFAVSLLIIVFALINSFVFFYSEGDKLFYILAKVVALCPIAEIVCGVCCVVDLFIAPDES